ncbi:hypothetical protein OH76DRAFT_1024545 [Lentinus brumalis]|uniref:Uncharacterized protein n=1 Tax=Lentinus brumalis TaxID=2498619 RepID=A0A371CXM9_9APHY|nr:hypothetical protein OH76DRAFT_1024545 [Polyporus brumalis]
MSVVVQVRTFLRHELVASWFLQTMLPLRRCPPASTGMHLVYLRTCAASVVLRRSRKFGPRTILISAKCRIYPGHTTPRTGHVPDSKSRLDPIYCASMPRPVRPGAPRIQRHFNFVVPKWSCSSAENICPPHHLTSTHCWDRSAARKCQCRSCRVSNLPHPRSMRPHPHAPQPTIARSVRYRAVTSHPRPRYKPHRAARCLHRRQEATRTRRRQSF